MKLLPLLLLLLSLSKSATSAQTPTPSAQNPPPSAQPQTDFSPLFAQVGDLVTTNFYNPNLLLALDFPSLLTAAKHDPAATTSPGAVRAIRALLEKLKTSHTAYYTPHDRSYYDLLDIFARFPNLRRDMNRLFPPQGSVVVASVGMVTTSIPGRGVFVREVFPHSPAAQAAIRAGDRITCAADQDAGVTLLDLLQRGDVEIGVQSAEGGEVRGVSLTPREVNPSDEYLAVMSDAARIERRDGKRLAYVRIYSWAGRHYQDRLEELLTTEPLDAADGLVLDIRGGWGGASPEYVNIFNHAVPSLTQTTRGTAPSITRGAWTKPVVLLVDEGSRSGKEIIAYAFKKHAIGPVVGARTAGGVLGGKAFLLSDDSLLYLAVSDVLVDGERLEGVGVEPDVSVARDLPFSAGHDPQLDAAFDTLLHILTPTGDGHP